MQTSVLSKPGVIIVLSILPLMQLASHEPCSAPAIASSREGELVIHQRKRQAALQNRLQDIVTIDQKSWKPKQTALIICDVWDKHWCQKATERCGVIAPKIDQFAKHLRAQGVLVIHAPSDCMKSYEGSAGRKLAQQATSDQPAPKCVTGWCRKLTDEPPLPIDDSDGGCDDQPASGSKIVWKQEHPAIAIESGDAVSDSGVEIWNLLQSRGISNVLIAGVHTNMCIAGRPFGLRALKQAGFDVTLVRDLTDAMYNPARKPFVSHDMGTQLVIEHLERYVAPSVTSTEVLTGSVATKNVLFVIGEDEYETHVTLPEFAREMLPKTMSAKFALVNPDSPNDFAGFSSPEPDVIVLSVRRRTPKKEQLAWLRRYLDAGKPLVGIRTACHAFALRPSKLNPEAKPADCHDHWPTFDQDVFGSMYEGHYNRSKTSPINANLTSLFQSDDSAQKRLTEGLPADWSVNSHLYKMTHTKPEAIALVSGRSTENGAADHMVAWLHSYRGGRIFNTTLGSIEDFQAPEFRTLLRRGIEWACDLPISK